MPSDEAVHALMTEEGETERRSIPASNAFVPSVAGLIIAGEVIKDLIKINKN